QLRETASAIFLGRGHAQDAELAQAGDHLPRNLGVAIDSHRVELGVGEAAQLGDRLFDRLTFLQLDLRVREDQGRIEMTEEQPLGEATRLRPGEQQLLRLLLLLFQLLWRQCHDFSSQNETTEYTENTERIRSRQKPLRSFSA